MTAVGAALLIAAFAAWLWQQVGLVNLPNKQYSVAVRQVVSGELAKPGTPVTLYSSKFNKEGKSEALGTSKIISVETLTASSTIVIEPPAMNAGRVPQDADQIGAPAPATGTETFAAAALVPLASISGVPVIQPVYVQAGVAIVILLIGAGFVYWLVGLRPTSVDFLVSTDGEMKKVNWSTRREIMGSTWVVIGATFLISLIIFVCDLGLQAFFTAIGVLQR
ncbi:MAG: preprotein translocase subunit SecE [Planctomycetota bacterium]|nr:preprotein translocase subunit SecE [Planctomycetota bacterium]